MDRIPITREGYDKLKAELERMENDEMPRIAQQIADARAFGDLSENAEFHAAVEAQGMLEARIRARKEQLSLALIVDPSKLPTDRVVFGSKVKVRDVDDGDEEVFQLVGPGEEDYDNNKILLNSPIGQGLLGKKIGETAEIKIPKGTWKVEVVEISG